MQTIKEYITKRITFSKLLHEDENTLYMESDYPDSMAFITRNRQRIKGPLNSRRKYTPKLKAVSMDKMALSCFRHYDDICYYDETYDEYLPIIKLSKWTEYEEHSKIMNFVKGLLNI